MQKQKSKDFPDSFFRVSIKGICVADDKVLLEREGASLGGGWELPGGGLDYDEDMRIGLMREIEEETGLKIKSVSEKPVYIWTTRIENWRGLDWYYTLCLGYRIEFESMVFQSTEECQELRFFSKEELIRLPENGRNPQTESFKKIFDPKDF